MTLPDALEVMRRRIAQAGAASWSDLHRAGAGVVHAWDTSPLTLIDPATSVALTLGAPIAWADFAPDAGDGPAVVAARSRWTEAVDVALGAQFALALLAVDDAGTRALLPPTSWQTGAGRNYEAGAYLATAQPGRVHLVLPHLALPPTP